MMKMHEILFKFKMGEIKSESAKNELAKLVILSNKKNAMSNILSLSGALNLSLNNGRVESTASCSQYEKDSNTVDLPELTSPATNIQHLERISGTDLVERNLCHRRGRVASFPQFPELVHLNKNAQGRPVFWIHGALGDVYYYSELAEIVERPFFGIQMRGRIGNRYPLYSMPAMAAYYSHIIQAVQPSGPYDLGGYSGGGTLAYEVTRQLQELGCTVNSVVMLDTVWAGQFSDVKLFSNKSIMLSSVNHSLTSLIPLSKRGEPYAFEKKIHCNEVDSSLDDSGFLDQLFYLAKTKGLIKNYNLFRVEVERNIKIIKSFDIDNYPLYPLTDSKSVDCYYFRNKNGIYMTDRQRPYALVQMDEMNIDNRKYWKIWEKQFSNFHMIDVDSDHHMELLLNPKSKEVIFQFCKKLYSNSDCE